MWAYADGLQIEIEENILARVFKESYIDKYIGRDSFLVAVDLM